MDGVLFSISEIMCHCPEMGRMDLDVIDVFLCV